MSVDIKTLTSGHTYFEDFNVGDVFEHARGKTVTEFDNVIITNLVMNTAQIHFNEHMTATLPYKSRLVFGGVTAALVIGLAMQDTGENAVMELGLDELRLRAPVFHGDTLYAYSEVLEKREAPSSIVSSKHDAGEVVFHHWGINQHNEIVFEAKRRVLIRKRPRSS